MIRKPLSRAIWWYMVLSGESAYFKVILGRIYPCRGIFHVRKCTKIYLWVPWQNFTGTESTEFSHDLLVFFAEEPVFRNRYCTVPESKISLHESISRKVWISWIGSILCTGYTYDRNSTEIMDSFLDSIPYPYQSWLGFPNFFEKTENFPWQLRS